MAKLCKYVVSPLVIKLCFLLLSNFMLNISMLERKTRNTYTQLKGQDSKGGMEVPSAQLEYHFHRDHQE